LKESTSGRGKDVEAVFVHFSKKGNAEERGNTKKMKVKEDAGKGNFLCCFIRRLLCIHLQTGGCGLGRVAQDLRNRTEIAAKNL
jgi:hypothetical protein